MTAPAHGKTMTLADLRFVLPDIELPEVSRTAVRQQTASAPTRSEPRWLPGPGEYM